MPNPPIVPAIKATMMNPASSFPFNDILLNQFISFLHDVLKPEWCFESNFYLCLQLIMFGYFSLLG